MATIYIGNPVAHVHVTIWALDGAHALTLANRFAAYAEYPVLDIRIDNCLAFDEPTLATWETDKEQKQKDNE
ncbi:hypothetical protein LJC45_02940 [Alistipes sp. OttesenSCG-928-B03]|nr:hypothetical protein [Alistipes sp. OttesenSCG-928-B03]